MFLNYHSDSGLFRQKPRLNLSLSIELVSVRPLCFSKATMYKGYSEEILYISTIELFMDNIQVPRTHEVVRMF